MRGDRPVYDPIMRYGKRFTPHERGSTSRSWYSSLVRSVYPACAGIDRRQVAPGVKAQGLPRMRGDRPFDFFAGFRLEGFTPHARGSTHLQYL